MARRSRSVAPSPVLAAVTAAEEQVAPWLRDLLRCPVTGEELLDAVGPDSRPCLLSRGARLAYPVRDGVPVLLVDQALPLGPA